MLGSIVAVAADVPPMTWLPELAEARVVHVPSPGSTLQRVPVLRSTEGELNVQMALGPVRLTGPNVSLLTRALNGSVPGKALAVFPGDRLSIAMANQLQAPPGPDAENSYHHPNTTNLHVHGLHVPAVQPGDDVLATIIPPGKTWKYQYSIPSDHSPGTYWVHPHAHGSAVMQTGAGAAAPLLVLDPPGFLSPQLDAMDDVVLMVQDLPRSALQSAAKKSQDGLFRVDRWNWGPDLWLVNGAPEPVLDARPGDWQRLRFIMASVSSWLNIDFGECEVALLAKDGIYIRDFPRLVPRVKIPPGGRADVVVRCPGGKDHSVLAAPNTAGGAKAFVGKLFTIRVPSLSPDSAEEALHPWVPPSTPRYLQDLRTVAEPDCACGTSMGLGGNTRWMAGHLWEGPTRYLHRSPRDAVVERRLSGVAKHPYHQHNYPFQLMETPASSDPYFKAGDWHDTYLNVERADAVVRFQTVDFEGPQVVHCHILSHSDQGMIAVEMVQGPIGRGSCGCDLLDAAERMPSAPAAEPLASPAALSNMAMVLFVAMLGLVLLWGVQLARSWRSAVESSRCYHTLPEGPSNKSNKTKIASPATTVDKTIAVV